MPPTRPLPSSPDAEREVLGWLIGSRPDAHDVLAMLRPEDFHDKRNEKVYEAISDLHRSKKTVDLITVCDRMRAMGLLGYLAASGGEAYVSELLTGCYLWSLEHQMEHARLILDSARRRALIFAAKDLEERAYRGEQDSGAIAEQTQSALGSLCDRSHVNVPKPFREVLHAAVKELERRYHNKCVVTGIPTSLEALDSLVHGWQYKEITIIGARPSMGKTALIVQSAVHGAMMGHPGLIFTLEMAEQELTMRSLANQSGVNGRALKTGYLQSTEWVKLTKAITRMADLPLHIDEDASQTADTMCSKARRWRRDPQIFQSDTKGGFIVVDFLQLVNSGITKKNSNRDQEVTYVTRQLKALAKELGVAVVALASLNRELEKRADKRPISSDLRDSGNIESDADTIIMLYRDEVYNPETEDKGVMELLVRKARNGSTGEVKAKWIAESTRVEDMPQDKGYQG